MMLQLLIAVRPLVAFDAWPWPCGGVGSKPSWTVTVTER